jgi:hypothetical protein
MHIEAEQHQVLRGQRETDGLAFTGAEGNPLEPVQLFDSGRDRGKALMGVQGERILLFGLCRNSAPSSLR